MVQRTAHRPTPPRALVWVLVLAVLTLTLTPLHYHLRHDNAGAVSSSVMLDLHSVVQGGDLDHHNDLPTMESAGAIVGHNMVVTVVPLVVLFLALFSIVALPRAPSGVLYRRLDDSLPRFYWHTTPPLRGPPLN